ncbi:unnamed protein product [Oncorhynchus mykiss]|uniref:Uncharacterized protein n=1 Tax=Oncorhynchus mykiss TaxID=8022 RepID=A0A060YA63_ONCMY|nr:unnamed protein product [Oncorhynchus mykiss]
MEITPDELRKVVESKEFDTSFLDMSLPNVICMIMALSVAFLVISMICLWISRKKSPGQGKEGFLQCKDMQKLCHGFELQEQVLLKMDSMEQRIAALEGFLRSMWRRSSRGNGTQEAADKNTDALGFSNGSD